MILLPFTDGYRDVESGAIAEDGLLNIEDLHVEITLRPAVHNDPLQVEAKLLLLEPSGVNDGEKRLGMSLHYPQDIIRVEFRRAEDVNILDPDFMVLDETDSGLDIDALRVVSDGINMMRDPNKSMMIITHYQRLLDYVVPDHVHVLADGRIVKSGGKELAKELEEKGYADVA